MNRLTQELIKVDLHHGHHSTDYLRWLFQFFWMKLGYQPEPEKLPPENVRSVIATLAELYLDMVNGAAPFTDLLGESYMELSAAGHKRGLGQYFTPWPVAMLMAMINKGEPIDHSTTKRLIRVLDPAVGSGRLLLAFATVVLAQEGPKALRHYSFTGIDLDPICAEMAALQFAVNAAVHGIPLGELCFYRGNALTNPEALHVVLHATNPDIDPAELIPANDPGRLAALQADVKRAQAEQLSLFGS